MLDTMHVAIDAREKGQVPISIATSLAIEGALGIYPDRPESPPPIQNAQAIWFNIRTLYRNLVNSLSAEVRDSANARDLLPHLREEMTIIENALIATNNGMTRTTFYLCDHSDFYTRFPRAKFKSPVTDRQIVAMGVETDTLSQFLKDRPPHDFRLFKTEITAGSAREKDFTTFVVSHQPVDLLSRYAFKSFILLESHTGKLKSAGQWGTKLNSGKDFPELPFNKFTLQVFGDGVHFSPLPGPVRHAVLARAKDDHWTPITTRDKMLASVQKIEDKDIRTLLMTLL